ncbi:MAG: HEPN domain-containing protein [Chloroflexi bacterium]|nr:HEPN domain-containing protein [Chloroflexota bacterium]
MKPEDLEYIGHRVSRAWETLAEAEALFNGGFTIGVVNRLYYACFYAVSALLLAEGHSSSKHSGVMSLFDRLWIKPRRLPAEAGEFYHVLFNRRQKGDYEDVLSFSKADLEAWLNQARLFIEQIAAWLEGNIRPD